MSSELGPIRRKTSGARSRSLLDSFGPGGAKVAKFLSSMTRALVLALLCSFYAFIINTLIIIAADVIFAAMGVKSGGCDQYVGTLVDVLKEYGQKPFIETLKHWFETTLFKINAPTSTAVGSAFATYLITINDAKTTITEQIRAIVSVCDEAWDVDGFLQELTEAMKGSTDRPGDHLAQAKYLIEVWGRYKEVFDSIFRDHNGDVARLKILLSGDNAANSEHLGQANGYMNQEAWQILSRIALTHKERRQLIVNGLRNLLDKIGVIDQASILERYAPPRINFYTLALAIAFGLGFFVLALRAFIK